MAAHRPGSGCISLPNQRYHGVMRPGHSHAGSRPVEEVEVEEMAVDSAQYRSHVGKGRRFQGKRRLAMLVRDEDLPILCPVAGD